MLNKNKNNIDSHILLKLLPFLVIIITVVILVLRGNFSLETLLYYCPDSYLPAFFFFLFMYLIKCLSVIFPLWILFVAAGIIFPPVIALLVTLVGIIISFSIPYYIGTRYDYTSFHKHLAKYPKLLQYIDVQKENGWFLTFILRILGFLPGDIISMYLGSLRISLLQYLIASILGILPNALLYILIGTSITDPTSPTFLLSLLGKILFSASTLLMYRFYKKRKMT